MMHEDKGRAMPPTQEVEMTDPEVIRGIKTLAGLGWGSKRIAGEMGVARNTARRFMRLPPELDPTQKRPGAQCLSADATQMAIALFEAEAEGNAVVVQRLLDGQGVRASLRTVQRTVAPTRREQRRAQVASVRYETAPGKQMQIDFGQKWVSVANRRTRVYFFVAVLGYSRRIFARALLSERIEDWSEGIAAAFEHFGGVPLDLLIDNPRAMVLGRDDHDKLILNPAFEAFCRDWEVTARACRPYRARTKGKTEAGVKYVKRNAIAGLAFTSFAALQQHLAEWVTLADRRVHGTTHQVPAEMFDTQERAALRPLPQRRLPVRQRILQRKVANDALVNVDTIRYSVPHRWVGEIVQVCVGDEEVRIQIGNEVVARHARSREPHARVTRPEHYEGLWRPQYNAAPTDPAPAPEVPAEGSLVAHGRSLDDYAAAIAQGVGP